MVCFTLAWWHLEHRFGLSSARNPPSRQHAQSESWMFTGAPPFRRRRFSGRPPTCSRSPRDPTRRSPAKAPSLPWRTPARGDLSRAWRQQKRPPGDPFVDASIISARRGNVEPEPRNAVWRARPRRGEAPQVETMESAPANGRSPNSASPTRSTSPLTCENRNFCESAQAPLIETAAAPNNGQITENSVTRSSSQQSPRYT